MSSCNTAEYRSVSLLHMFRIMYKNKRDELAEPNLCSVVSMVKDGSTFISAAKVKLDSLVTVG